MKGVMNNIRIVTDSASDLTAEQVAEYGITVVPLSIRFGADEYVDRKDLTPQTFWEKVAASPTLPETAAPSPGAFEAAFREAGANGAPVVCLNLSSKLSATYSAAVLAARACEGSVDVRVVDSLSITSGLGSMAIAAAKVANAGGIVDEVVAAIESRVGRTRVLAAIDTLDNLKKGGRIGGAQAFLGSLLSIKPLIDVSTGVVEEAGKQRTRGKALNALADMVKADIAKHGKVSDLSIRHGDAKDVDAMVALLSGIVAKESISIGQIGAVIGAHGGTGLMGLTYLVG
jgi:DegV family protein with EDD domain